MVYLEVRNNVLYSDVGLVKCVVGVVDSVESDEKINVVEDDIFGVFVIVEGVVWVEVVYVVEEFVCFVFVVIFMLVFVEVMVSDVVEEVYRLVEKLLVDEVDGCGNGGFFSEFVKFVNEFV